MGWLCYFCGNTEIGSDITDREPQRTALYKATASLVRAYANIADEMEAAGYSLQHTIAIKRELDHYLNLRDIIRKASGESLDLKTYEADMRHLIDTYITAEDPRKISPFDDLSLLELIVKTGIAEAINAHLDNLKGNRDAIAETIENNVRRKIIKEHLNDPAYFEKLSQLLDEIIAARKQKAVAYEDYLKRIAELVKKTETGHSDQLPATINTPGKRALYHNVGEDEERAIKIDQAVKRVRPDDWRGVQTRENIIKKELFFLLQDEAEVERIFAIIKQQSEY